jgi:hypothetical protein
MRISDEDRQRTIEELRRHCAAGRIDVDEYAARIERALSATTLTELDEIRADLPMLRIAQPAERQARSGPDRGVATASRRASTEGGPDSSRDFAGRAGRPTALVVALITVAVVLAALVVSLAFEWTWAVVILAAWAVGVIQGRLRRRGRPGD